MSYMWLMEVQGLDSHQIITLESILSDCTQFMPGTEFIVPFNHNTGIVYIYILLPELSV